VEGEAGWGRENVGGRGCRWGEGGGGENKGVGDKGARLSLVVGVVERVWRRKEEGWRKGGGRSRGVRGEKGEGKESG
jgi:hypothetical protein